MPAIDVFASPPAGCRRVALLFYFRFQLVSMPPRLPLPSRCAAALPPLPCLSRAPAAVCRPLLLLRAQHAAMMAAVLSAMPLPRAAMPFRAAAALSIITGLISLRRRFHYHFFDYAEACYRHQDASRRRRRFSSRRLPPLHHAASLLIRLTFSLFSCRCAVALLMRERRRCAKQQQRCWLR